MYIGLYALLREDRRRAAMIRKPPPPAPPSDGQLWAQAVIANGGTVSAAEAIRVEIFIIAEKTADTWALTDDYWALWCDDPIAARTSIKQRRLGTLVNGPAHEPGLGYTFDGATNYIQTNFIVPTHCVAMTGGNLRLAVYEWNNLAADTYSAGYTDTGHALFLTPQNAAGFARGTANASGTGASYTLLSATSRGYTAISRNGPLLADHKCFKNGVSLAWDSGAPIFNDILPSAFLYIGCVVSGGTPTSHRANTIGFVAMGAALSEAQELAQYSNLQAWLGTTSLVLDTRGLGG
jgi:hypothetical protein